jgi:hypothetical protein
MFLHPLLLMVVRINATDYLQSIAVYAPYLTSDLSVCVQTK